MKVFVLGIDGATFDILDPLMDQDSLPNIKEMIAIGTSGRLQTIFPPVTAPAWLALATGLNPGKTGAYDYINRVEADSDEYVPISSRYYHKLSIWDILNDAGHSVGIFNYPTLSPPPKVNGFAVSGMGGKKGNMTYPADLEDEIESISGGYESRLNLRNSKYSRNIDGFFDDIDRVFSKQAKVLLKLVKREKWDFLFGVFSITDWMGHVLWKHIDPGYPSYDPIESPGVYDKFKKTWSKIDDLIGEIDNSLPEDAEFIIVSDHGMGPLNSVFYPNTWLKDKGWLKKKDLGWKGFLGEKLRLFSEGFDNKYTNAVLYRLKSRLLKIHGSVDFIDYERSLAYSPEHNTMFGCINLTEKGKNEAGFKEKLIEAVNKLPDEFPEITNVETLLPENIFSGPHVDLSPDIFFIINNYQSTVEIDFNQKPYVGRPSLGLRTGGHRADGIFIAKGNYFQKNVKISASILDIAPTILSLYRCQIPGLMDGNVLIEAIRPERLCELSTEKTEKVKHGFSAQKGLENGELEDMKDMLKSLGYM